MELHSVQQDCIFLTLVTYWGHSYWPVFPVQHYYTKGSDLGWRGCHVETICVTYRHTPLVHGPTGEDIIHTVNMSNNAEGQHRSIGKEKKNEDEENKVQSGI